MSFGELCVLVIVGIVVIGPKDLPRFLRKAGQLAGKLRRMATDVRAQSGIDEVLRSEGLTKDIAEIRRLAQGEFMEPLRVGTAVAAATSTASTPAQLPDASTGDFVVMREREYPTEGSDSYAAIPDTAIVYAKGLPPSPLAKDPLYILGDADAVIPPEPEPEPEPEPMPDVPVTDAPVADAVVADAVVADAVVADVPAAAAPDKKPEPEPSPNEAGVP
jgi:sec-independent protein translocase protein TatB